MYFKNYNINESVIISSETRGGSTWLMELLSNDPGTIINWEPLHESKGVVPESLNWGTRPFIRANEYNKTARQLMNKILRFKIFSKNSVRYVTFLDMVKANKVLTKMVRSNLLLPWLTENFDFLHKPIYLLRHPIAVAISQIKNIPETEKELGDFQIPDTINNERYKENLNFLNSLKTILERQVALWCIHNMEIINHPDCGQHWVVVFYEDLLLDPEKEIRRITKEINLRIHIDKIKFDKPSSTDFFNEFQQDRMKQLNKWKGKISSDELKKIQKVFDHYKLKLYNANDVLPVKPAKTATV